MSERSEEEEAQRRGTISGLSAKGSHVFEGAIASWSPSASVRCRLSGG